MILLDTDHVTVLGFPETPRSALLAGRMRAARGESFAITVVTAEEQMRGWLAEINRWRSVHKQIRAYEKLAELFDFLSSWEIVRWDSTAADEFERQRKQGLRIGSQDLKIASIALVHNARLLSANLRDFRQVPGLLVENWLE